MTAMEKKDKNLNVPNLRFPEFSGEWERRSLSDLVIRVTRKNKNNESRLPLTISAQYGLVDQISFFNKVVASNDMSNYYLLHNGEFAYNKSYSGDYPWGAIKRLDLYEKGALSSLYICFAPKNTVDSDFLVHYFESPKWYKEVSNIAGEGARNHGLLNISVPDFFNTRHWIPSCKAEQRKIAALLNLVEERIHTQKKIIEDLKKLKDAISNLNFTSGSALKLGNVGKFVRGLTYSASDVIDYTIGTAVMRSNNITNGDPVNFEELVWVNKIPNHEQILRGGDIVICMANGSSPLVGKASYYVDCGMESATVGAFCGIYRSDNPLTKWLFQSKHYKKHIQRCIQGGNGAIANIYPEDILAISFNIPCGYERVLNILNSLEEKYLLEQKLLSRYLGVKSYLLSRLFI